MAISENLSDIVFGQDSGRRISNQHFRIFLEIDMVLMLQDMSTNGTVVRIEEDGSRYLI